MASMEPISIHIQPAPYESPSNLCALTSTSLDALSPHTVPDHAVSGQRSYSDAALAVQPSHHSRRKLYKLRDELEHVCSQVKQKGAKLNQRVSKLLHNADDDGTGDRRIKVEYMDSDSAVQSDTEDGDTLELPDHNYSPSLKLTGLRDGCFSAELPLDALPTGQITIRIRNYKMEVIVGRRASLVDDKHRVTCPVRYGDIDIPIYVNPASLSFSVDASTERLCVSGFTKGYNNNQGFSASDSALHIHHSGRKTSSFERLTALGRSRSFNRFRCSLRKEGSPTRALTVTHSISG